MPKITVTDCPYFVWRDGRPRWSPGPKLRAIGWKGQDLKDDAGAWLSFEAAIGAARAINARVGEAGRTAPAIVTTPGRTVADLLDGYFASPDFKRRPENTRKDYVYKADAIRFELRTKAERKASKRKVATVFSAAPAKALTPVEVKAFFEHILARRGLHMARGAIMVLSAACAWGRLSAAWRLRDNPCHALDLPKPAPRVRIATDAEIRALVAMADAQGVPSIGDAIITALLSGQRESDVLALAEPKGANRPLSERLRDGEGFTVIQGKTGAKVTVFGAPQLIARLAAAEPRRRAILARIHGDVLPIDAPREIILMESSGRPWVQSWFQHRYAEIRAMAAEGDPTRRGFDPCPSVADVNFQDLRDTAITWLARAGCTIPQIAAISGHSLKSIHTILKHYLQLDEILGREAIAKLVDWIDREGIRI
jgi:integrase